MATKPPLTSEKCYNNLIVYITLYIMVYRFTFLSDEVDDFNLIIDADSEATFLELHKTILNSVKFNQDQITSFFMCNDDWEKEQEVTLIEMESSSEYDNLVMESTKLEELLVDEKQKLLYIFDPMFDRAFFGELSEIIPGKSLKEPVCVKLLGHAPEQMKLEDDIDSIIKGGNSIDENFYGDEGFNEDELDEEGFGDMNFDDSSLFSDDGKY